MPNNETKFSIHEPILLAISLTMAGFLVWLNYLPYTDWIDRRGCYFGSDFVNFWLGPKLAFGEGKVDVLPSLSGYFAEVRGHFGNILTYYNWSYPPFTLLLLWPLAQLSYFTAYALFTLLSFAVFFYVGLKATQPEHRGRMLLLAVFSPAALFNIICGQNGFVTGALLLGGMLLLAQKPVRAGLLVGLLSFKPQLGLLVPVVMIVRRAWLAILMAMLVLCGLVFASVVAFGIQPWQDYLTITADHQRWLLEDYSGYFAQMLVSPYAALRTLGLTYHAALMGQALFTFIAVAATICVFRAKQATLPQQLLVLCTAIPLAMPYSVAYDLPALSLLLADRLARDQRLNFNFVAYSLCWLSPAFVWLANGQSNCLIQLGLLLTLLAALKDIQYRRNGAVAGVEAEVAGTR